jgi:hypothetical protein
MLLISNDMQIEYRFCLLSSGKVLVAAVVYRLVLILVTGTIHILTARY